MQTLTNYLEVFRPFELLLGVVELVRFSECSNIKSLCFSRERVDMPRSSFEPELALQLCGMQLKREGLKRVSLAFRV